MKEPTTTSHNADALPLNITPPGIPNHGICFVDHSKKRRSGHLGHALVQYAPGKILAFYANCSDANNGHTGDGWMEYKRSEDGGHTWSEPMPLAYSKSIFEADSQRSVMCEKAVCTCDGDILLFNLECANVKEWNYAWQPHRVPTVLRSSDGGTTWSVPKPVGHEPGRIWDALYDKRTVYVLKYHNDATTAWYCNCPEHQYMLYVSEDNGRTFTRRSVLPFDSAERGYGALAILPDKRLIAYTYTQTAERQLDYVISADAGNTWSTPRTTPLVKQIRNPQIASFKCGYVLHGRSGSGGGDAIRGHLVLYTSRDGIHWDEGRYLQMRQAGTAAYSNNVTVQDAKGEMPDRLLIQASHAYENNMTNIYHWWLT